MKKTIEELLEAIIMAESPVFLSGKKFIGSEFTAEFNDVTQEALRGGGDWISSEDERKAKVDREKYWEITDYPHGGVGFNINNAIRLRDAIYAMFREYTEEKCEIQPSTAESQLEQIVHFIKEKDWQLDIYHNKNMFCDYIPSKELVQSIEGNWISDVEKQQAIQNERVWSLYICEYLKQPSWEEKVILEINGSSFSSVIDWAYHEIIELFPRYCETCMMCQNCSDANQSKKDPPCHEYLEERER